jgi:hypothetical protein
MSPPVGVNILEDDGEVSGFEKARVAKVLCFRQGTRIKDCDALSASTLTTADIRRRTLEFSQQLQYCGRKPGDIVRGSHISRFSGLGPCGKATNARAIEMKKQLLPTKPSFKPQWLRTAWDIVRKYETFSGTYSVGVSSKKMPLMANEGS